MASDDELDILREVEAFSEAWNRGDPKGAASFFAEDGVRVGAFGDVERGRAEVEAGYARLLQQSMPGASVRQDRGEVRMLTPEFAIWQGGIEITPPGGASMKGHVVQVMKKVNGRWLVLEAHPKFFPPRR